MKLLSLRGNILPGAKELQQTIMIPDYRSNNYRDVAAIITAMTDGEKPFLSETMQAVLADRSIGQVVLCIAENNQWVTPVLGVLTEDPRLKIARMPLAKVGVVRNRALEHVTLPWVAFCDGDDVWCAGKTSVQRAWADKTNSDLVGVDHSLMDESGKVCSFAFARYLPMLSAWLVRTEILKKYPFDGSLLTGSDGEWWIRTNHAIRKAKCPKTLLKYRIRANSLSSTEPSRRRKARVVSLGKLPVVRASILGLTWCLWWLTRQEHYACLKEWEQQSL